MNQFKSIMTSTIAASFLLLGGLGMAAPAHADVAPISAEDEMKMRDIFTTYDVSGGTQDELLDTLASGQLWDNALPTAEPVEVEDYSDSSASITVERYADGSISVQSVEKPQPSTDSNQIGAFGVVENCTISGGSGFSVATGCTVSNQWVNVYVAFTASYQLVNGADDSITSLGPTTQVCLAGSCTRPDYIIQKLQEDVEGPAFAQAQTTFTATSGVGSSEYWVRLTVGNDFASASNS